MACKEYLKLCEKAQNKKLKLMKKQEKQIVEIYKELYLETSKKINSLDPNSLGTRYAKVMKDIFEQEIRKANIKVKKLILKNAETSSSLSNNVQLDFFNMLNEKYDLNMENTFISMFGSINKDAVKEIVFGGAYKDRKGLSERIWQDTRKKNKDIENIIVKGLSNKTSAKDLAKELLEYINPSINNPGYCSKRLARTVINHAFQMAQKRSCSKNPFVTGIEWQISNHGNVCPLCKDREGIIYKVNELPLDHPMGRCCTIPVIPDSLESIGGELNEWRNGAENERLDKWFNKYAKEFI